MKPVDASSCRVHVSVCTNERPAPKSCCKAVGGQDFYLKLKERVRDAGLRGTYWVTRTGCLGFCNDVGTTVAIHVQGEPPRWFTEVTEADLEAIWAQVHGS